MLKKSFGLSLLAVAGTSQLIVAQDPTPAKSTTASTQKPEKVETKVAMTSLRISKLMGMKLHNAKNEHVGQIKDFVFDPATARVQYVAVTYGGFLGLGDKLFAVPFHAIKMNPDPANKNQMILTLDVTKEQLTGAQGFDEEHWPDFSDTKLSADLHRRYGVTDRWNQEIRLEKGLDVKVNRPEIPATTDGAKK